MSPTFRSLANPNYRRYAAGSLVSNTGTWMQRIAQDWLVLVLTGSGTALGITTGLQFLPVLLLSPYAGVIADRFPKRRLLQITQAAMGLASLALGLVTVLGVVQVWHVYLIALVFGIGAAFDAPARQSFVSELVDADDLTNAVGLNSATFNMARILGPGLAGLMIGALGGGAWATGWVILINAVSYGAVIWQLQAMDAALLNPSKPARRTPGMLRDGIRYVAGQPKMVLVLILVFFAGTFGMNFQITSALMATEVYGKGAGEFGLLGSTMALGSLTGALMAARRVRIRLRLLVIAAAGFGLAEIVAGVLPTYVLFVAFTPLIGFSTITLLNSANAVMQLESDPEMRGRVMALYMTIVMGGTPLGAPVIGWIGEVAGARWTLVIGGLLVLLGTALAVTVHQRMEGRGRGVRGSILTLLGAPSTVNPRVWDNPAVARAQK
ncbi:MFS transporter [Nocardioides sp. AE5]|uniref:MFS transporter n=1 Tax=Nocardioides sp. AE5 TaxID=2962573 RepID=UPI002882A774|nr:MFS transporter [Nocardioides sp. AE5]MDT0203698.1 MFS transporter [Nocardioides sp. AE5]